MKKNIFWGTFVLYSLCMLYLLFFQRMGRTTNITYGEWLRYFHNFIPFQTVTEFIQMAKNNTFSNGYLFQLAVKNLGGNVILFLPLGIFLPALFQRQKHFRVFLGTITLTIVLVELIQLFTMLGSCDIDDLILNVLGAVCGFGVWKSFCKIQAKRKAKIE